MPKPPAVRATHRVEVTLLDRRYALAIEVTAEAVKADRSEVVRILYPGTFAALATPHESDLTAFPSGPERAKIIAMAPETVSDKDAALSIARRIIELLREPVSDEQRQMIFDEITKTFCVHCGRSIVVIGLKCCCQDADEAWWRYGQDCDDPLTPPPSPERPER